MITSAICFNPRSPRGERRSTAGVNVWTLLFQSTLPAWGATIRLDVDNRPQAVSIHAPRVGSDALRFLIREHSGNVSIHAPRVGSDPDPVEYAGARR